MHSMRLSRWDLFNSKRTKLFQEIGPASGHVPLFENLFEILTHSGYFNKKLCLPFWALNYQDKPENEAQEYYHQKISDNHLLVWSRAQNSLKSAILVPIFWPTFGSVFGSFKFARTNRQVGCARARVFTTPTAHDSTVLLVFFCSRFLFFRIKMSFCRFEPVKEHLAANWRLDFDGFYGAATLLFAAVSFWKCQFGGSSFEAAFWPWPAEGSHSRRAPFTPNLRVKRRCFSSGKRWSSCPGIEQTFR